MFATAWLRDIDLSNAQNSTPDRHGHVRLGHGLVVAGPYEHVAGLVCGSRCVGFCVFTFLKFQICKAPLRRPIF